MAIKSLLWDFGDTLYDELSLWDASPEWMEVYRSFDDPEGIGMAWCMGAADLADVAAQLSQRMDRPEAEITAHLSDASLLRSFPFTLAFFHAQHLPQAIVTVNPASFRQLAADLGLDRSCELVVISADERTVDKGTLCRIALERMALDCTAAEALLIDNKASNLAQWAREGGVGYHYRGDDTFRTDVADGIAGLAARV